MEFKVKDRRGEAQNVLRQCQLVQLYLLEILDEICKKHGLKYYLDFGTLLGALRHDGAIPWDDDLDVSMPIEDYGKFLAVAAGELPRGILLQTPESNGGFFTTISRIRDCKSFYFEEWGSLKEPLGIFLDIYPLIKRRRVPESFGKLLFDIRKIAFGSEVGNRVGANYSLMQIWRHAVMATVWRVIDKCAIICEKVLSVGRPYCWTQSPGPASRLRQFDDGDIFPLKMHRYEGRDFPIPQNAEKLLEIYYGDWRALPSEEERNPYSKMKLVLPTESPRMWWAVR